MTAVAALVALPAAAAVIWLILRTGAASRMLARPRADRWHERATPVGGGVGIFTGLVAAISAGLLTDDVAGSSELYGILAGCTILFAAGLLDDRFSLGPLTKIAAQASAVAIVIASGVSVRLVENDYLATGIAVVWLIGVTNAFNLLDNMDGLAATLAAIAAGYFAIDAVTIHPNDTVLLLSLGVCFACIGFLPFNVRPGRPAAIFMGDSGSQVIGFALASLGLYASWNVAGTTVATLLLPILILAIPIFDTALVTIVRLLEGRPIYQGGLDHTSHRIVYRGLSERRALVLLAVISAALGGTSLAYNVLDNSRIALAGVLVTFALLVQFATIIGDVDRRAAVAARGPRLLRTFVVHRRRLIEVVVDAALVCASFLAAYLLVVEGSGTINQRHIFSTTLPVLLAARYGSFIVFGLYRSVWRYAGARDAANVIAAVTVSGLACYGIVEATRDFGDFPLEHLRHRRADLRRLPRRDTICGARDRHRVLVSPRPRQAAADADRRGGPGGPEPPARAARDPRRAGRRLRGRRRAPPRAPAPGGPGPRKHGRDRGDPRAFRPGRRAGHDPRGAARPARPRRPRMRAGRRAVPFRPPRARPRAGERPRRPGEVTTVAARRDGARATTALARLTGAIPVLTVFVWLTLIYAWQAVLVETPWLFTDELELTQLARSIADVGQPMRRDQEYWFAPLSAILTSPAWLLDGARASYDAMKYIDVVLMTAAIFPAYGLARFVASPRAALFAATGSVCIPAFMYSALLLEEPLAYAWSTLALFLIVRALAVRTPRAVVLAGVVALAAPLARTQLAVLPAIFALSALWLAWTSETGRRWWRGWSRGSR